jgi:hypothetical protein
MIRHAESMERLGTQHIGFLPDMGIFVKHYPRVMRDRFVRMGARESVAHLRRVRRPHPLRIPGAGRAADGLSLAQPHLRANRPSARGKYRTGERRSAATFFRVGSIQRHTLFGFPVS